MKSRAINAWGVLLVLALGQAGSAAAKPSRRAKAAPAADVSGGASHAQAPDLGPPAGELTAPSLDPELGVGGRLLPVDPQLMNEPEMLSLVKKWAVDIAKALVEGERHREEAVRQKDSIKLSCIQDRLTNMKLMKKLSDNRLASAERPFVRADALSLRHEFRGVEMAHQRVLQLQRELVECVGQNLDVTSVTAESGVSGFPSDSNDPTGVSTNTPPAERPVPASVYK